MQIFSPVRGGISQEAPVSHTGLKEVKGKSKLMHTGSATHMATWGHLQGPCIRAEMHNVRLSHFSNSEAVRELKDYLQRM